VGTSLREVRVSQLLTIRALAEAAGVATRTIIDIEAGGRGTPQIGTMRRISAALGVAPSQITEFAAAIDKQGTSHRRAGGGQKDRSKA
jgi:transcriptional regulator with XRE-family HTH domain